MQDFFQLTKTESGQEKKQWNTKGFVVEKIRCLGWHSSQMIDFITEYEITICWNLNGFMF